MCPRVTSPVRSFRSRNTFCCAGRIFKDFLDRTQHQGRFVWKGYRWFDIAFRKLLTRLTDSGTCTCSLANRHHSDSVSKFNKISKGMEGFKMGDLKSKSLNWSFYLNLFCPSNWTVSRRTVPLKSPALVSILRGCGGHHSSVVCINRVLFSVFYAVWYRGHNLRQASFAENPELLQRFPLSPLE